MRCLGRLVLLVLLGVAVVVGLHLLQQKPPGARPPVAPPSTAPPGQTMGAPPGPVQVNLSLVGARVVFQQGGRYLEVTVMNQGPGQATAVTGSCSYSCPSTRFSSRGQPFLQGGYLLPGRSVTGRLGLAPCPDPAIPVECLVQPGYGVTDTFYADNNWSGVVPNR